MLRSPEFRAIETFSKVAGRLPWGAGHYRIASRYASRHRWVVGSYADQRMRSGALVQLDLGDFTQSVAFLVRDYSPALTHYIVSRLPPAGTFLDVGSNVGLIAFAVVSLRPDATVCAFEPNPSNAAAWRHNQRLNNARQATLAEVALSDRRGRAEFSVPSDSASGAIRRGGEESVSTARLDDYCNAHNVGHIDVLKIDVEGHEPAVLRGASGLLAAGAISTILCEVLNVTSDGRNSIDEMLRRLGYTRTHVPPIGMRRLIPGSRGSEDDVAYER